MASYSSSIPHLYYQEIFDLTELIPIIEASQTAKQKVSLRSLLIKAFSLALTLHPKVNSIYQVNNPFNFAMVA